MSKKIRETCNKRPLVFEILSFNFAFYSLSLIISLVNSFWFFSGTNSSKLNDMALNSSSAAKINLTVVMIHKEYYWETFYDLMIGFVVITASCGCNKVFSYKNPLTSILIRLCYYVSKVTITNLCNINTQGQVFFDT